LTEFDDANFVPGIVKYGDLPALLALGAPHRLLLTGEQEVPAIVKAAYAASGAADGVTTDAASVAAWLMHK
jgi:hypothetical protein